MQQKKNVKTKAFPDVLLKLWEKNDGVDFAIALARLTGWMLQVDWLTSDEDEDVQNMIPIRVYVETNRNIVFDFIGKKSVIAFNKYVIQPIAFGRLRNGLKNITTRCYTEEALRELPLKVRSSDYGIEKATLAILAHPTFLASIPKRQNPEISAQVASQFSHGNCVPFAEVMQEMTALPAMGIEVSKYSDVSGSRLGFCHAVIVHTDGNVEDSWGIQPLSVILERFYIEDYTMSEQIFLDAKDRQKRESPDRYNEAYKKALNLLKTLNSESSYNLDL